MILKKADSKEPQINELKRLIQIAPASTRTKLEKELRMLQAGIKGENDAAYFIDFELKDSKNTGVIHDLRLEVNGRVAQIDHLLVNRTMNFYVLETKYFHSGIKIDEEGQFLKWNSYQKIFEGMPSPLLQNERHVTVLNDLINRIEWPARMGLKLKPTFEPLVLVSSQSRIDRPKRFDTNRVIKADELMKALEKCFDSKGVLGTFGAMAKLVSTDKIMEMGRTLIACHRPIMPDYAAKFGIEKTSVETSVSKLNSIPQIAEEVFSYVQEGDVGVCRKCKSSQTSIQYGKFGYYFKCSACDGNTPIKLGCGNEGHKERIRKEGPTFFRECAECGTSSLYFTNS